MYVGQSVLTKVEGKLVECTIFEIEKEDLVLVRENVTFRAKFWEVRPVVICDGCGKAVIVVGKTTMHYEPLHKEDIAKEGENACVICGCKI